MITFKYIELVFALALLLTWIHEALDAERK